MLRVLVANMVFFDASAVLELLLPGRAKVTQVEKIMERVDGAAISMLTVHLCFHFGARACIDRSSINSFLSNFRIEDLTVSDYEKAQSVVGNSDFEDALQLAVALRVGCTQIVTLDKQFARTYKELIDFKRP